MDRSSASTGERAEILLRLRDPAASGAWLETIGRDPRWLRHREIRRRLAAHRHTAPALALDLTAGLPWRDLCELAADLRVAARVRRKAEALLRTRLEEMSVGERTSLARRATRGVIPEMLAMPETLVLRGLLQNPRLSEAEAVRLAARRQGETELLEALARSARWGVRPAVRRELLANPCTPVPVALRLLRLAPRVELRRLARDVGVPRVVAVAAARRAEGRG